MSEPNMSPTLSEHVARLRAHLPDLSAPYQIASPRVFGSCLRGEERVDSDLDLLVDFQGPPSLLEFIRLEDEISQLLGVRGDLVMASALKPAIGRRILKEARPV